MTAERNSSETSRTVASRLYPAIEKCDRGPGSDANDVDPRVGIKLTSMSLLDAARALLEARENQMVIRVEPSSPPR